MVFRRRQQNVLRPVDVGGDGADRVVHDQLHADRRRQMEDRVRRRHFAFDEFGGVEHITFDHGQLRIAGDVPQIFAGAG